MAGNIPYVFVICRIGLHVMFALSCTKSDAGLIKCCLDTIMICCTINHNNTFFVYLEFIK